MGDAQQGVENVGLEKTTEQDCRVLDARPPHLDSVRHTAMDFLLIPEHSAD